MKKIIASLLCAVISLGLNALYGGVIIGATDGEVKDSLFSEWLAIKDDAEFLRACAILDAMADLDAYDTFADAQKQLTGKTFEEVAAAFDDPASKDLQKNLSLLDEINKYNVVIDVSLLRAKIADAQSQPTLSEALSQATEDVSLIIEKPCAIHLLEEVLKLNDKDFIDFVCVSAAHNLTAQDNDTYATPLDAKKLITELKPQYRQEYEELYSNFPSNNIVVQLGRFKAKELLDTWKSLPPATPLPLAWDHAFEVVREQTKKYSRPMYLVFLCPGQTDTKQEWTDRYWDQLKFRILTPRKLFPISIEVPNEVDQQSMTVKQLLKKYQVKTFPTVLIISPSGKVLMRSEGAPTLSLNDYVAAIKKAITPKTLKDRFKK